MSELPTRIALELPDWIDEAVDTTRVYTDDAAKIALAIELSRRNIDAGSGGPFGAVVFGPDERIIAAGVNRVLPLDCSLAHAETMACMLAQQRVGRSRLNVDEHGRRHGPITLATSAQPCCQCYGAMFWAGIDHLLIGARSQDVMTLTEFDEGPLPEDWVGELERRAGIRVVRDLQRDAACAVLRNYGEQDGTFY